MTLSHKWVDFLVALCCQVSPEVCLPVRPIFGTFNSNRVRSDGTHAQFVWSSQIQCARYLWWNTYVVYLFYECSSTLLLWKSVSKQCRVINCAVRTNHFPVCNPLWIHYWVHLSSDARTVFNFAGIVRIASAETDCRIVERLKFSKVIPYENNSRDMLTSLTVTLRSLLARSGTASPLKVLL